MNTNKHKSLGFTLVELIVVIAIIAVLSAVMLPSFTRFIDNGRYSNDVQKAASMTSILTNHFILEGDEDYDAYDVKALIDSYHGSHFGYIPEAMNTGFFYLENSQSVKALRFDEAEAVIAADTLLSSDTRVLSDDQLDEEELMNSPEEMFGNGGHLMTTEGSPVALVVSFIRNMATTGSNILSDYRDAGETYENYIDNIFVRLFGYGLDDETKTKLDALLSTFSPQTTLFVNNVDWVTTTTDGTAINKIVFAPGISSIPAFDLDLSVTGLSVTLPRTVKTIEAGAFPDAVFPDLTVSLRQNATVLAEPSAFGENVTQVGSVTTGLIDLIDYSDEVTITFSEDNSFSYDFSNLSIRDQVTGYAFDVSQGVVYVKITTNDGLVGYASNAYTINYILNEGDVFVYYQYYGAGDTFFLPPTPEISGYDFDGWYTDPGTWSMKIEIGAELPATIVNVYAKWTETN